MEAGTITVQSVVDEMTKYDPEAADIKVTVSEPIIDKSNREKMIRSVVTGALKVVPKAGSLLSGLVAIIWSEPEDPQMAWKDIESNVNKVAQGLIDDERARQIRLDVESLRDTLKSYVGWVAEINELRKGQDPAEFAQKFYTRTGADDLNYLKNYMNTKRTLIQNDPTPWKILGSIVLFGTIHLAVLRERVFAFKGIYGLEDPTPKTTRDELTKAIGTYTDAIKRAREHSIKERLSKLEISDITVEKVSYSESYYTSQGMGLRTKSYEVYSSYVRDSEQGINLKWEWKEGDKETERKKIQHKIFYSELREKVKAEYIAKLDNILLPTFTWGRFDNNKDKKPEEKTAEDIKYESNDEFIRCLYTGYLGSFGNTTAAGFSGLEQPFSTESLFEADPKVMITKFELFGDDSLGLVGFRVWHGELNQLVGKEWSNSRVITMGSNRDYISSAQVGILKWNSDGVDDSSSTPLSNMALNAVVSYMPLTTTSLRLCKKYADGSVSTISVGESSYGGSMLLKGIDDAKLGGLLYITGWYNPYQGLMQTFKSINFVCGYPIFA